jgi:hypothetical protein
METKKEIERVVNFVIDQYKFTSIPEFNALLHPYNVHADNGRSGSHLYEHGGLLYQVLDENKKPIGVPIKASLLDSQPTLAWLEKKFSDNLASRKPFREGLKNEIDLAILRSPGLSVQDFIELLDRQSISTVLRENEDGFIYGITYIDRKNRVVFNGSSLGKEYSAKAILERCGQKETTTSSTPSKPVISKQRDEEQVVRAPKIEDASPAISTGLNEASLLGDLLEPHPEYDPIPYELSGKKKKKKKRKS